MSLGLFFIDISQKQNGLFQFYFEIIHLSGNFFISFTVYALCLKFYLTEFESCKFV